MAELPAKFYSAGFRQESQGEGKDLEIVSIGSWTGTVQVGGTGAPSCFEIFDRKNTFDVILGKPWLKAICAQHDYITDNITIGVDGKQEVITNMLDDEAMNKTKTLNDETLTQPEPNVTVTNMSQQQINTQVKTTAKHQLTEEWAQIAQLGALDKPQDKVLEICRERDPDVDQLAKIIQGLSS